MTRLHPAGCYRRNLSHFVGGFGPFFLTFNLYGAIPRDVRALRHRQIDYLREHGHEQPWFATLESFLDRCEGPLWLGQPDVASVVQDVLRQWEGVYYDLDCYTLMPNHVHLILRPYRESRDAAQKKLSLPYIMHGIKRASAVRANRLLNRSGAFWQHESFDRQVRNKEEYNRIVTYILRNPVKAKLVSQWQQWPWTYLKE